MSRINARLDSFVTYAGPNPAGLGLVQADIDQFVAAQTTWNTAHVSAQQAVKSASQQKNARCPRHAGRLRREPAAQTGGVSPRVKGRRHSGPGAGRTAASQRGRRRHRTARRGHHRAGQRNQSTPTRIGPPVQRLEAGAARAGSSVAGGVGALVESCDELFGGGFGDGSFGEGVADGVFFYHDQVGTDGLDFGFQGLGGGGQGF